MKKKIWIPLGILAVLGVVAYFVLPSLLSGRQAGQASAYQTEAARLGDVSVTVGGTGTVRANQTATIHWQTSGKVSAVRVKKGQQVTEDDILAELDPSSLPQNILQAQVDLVNAKEALDKAINNSEARAAARIALINAQEALDDAEEEAQSKLYRRASQETIDIARANLINANEALDQAEGVWDQTKGMGEESPVYAAGLSQYAKARQEQQRAEYNLRYVEALPDPLDVEESNANVEQAKAKLLTAKQEWEKVKDGPDEDEVLAAQVRVDIAQATLDLARLDAPFAGTITDVESQPGDLVNASALAFQLDDLSRLLVDVDISEVDITQVKIGQPVTLTFDALPDQEFTGNVTDIASSGATTSGTVNFTVTMEIQNPSAAIKPGMTASVTVTVSELKGVLLVPSRAVRTIDNQRVVYVLRENVPVPVDVTLGASANSYTQITSGDLKEGDIVISNPSNNMLPIGPGSGGGGMGAMMGGRR